MPVKQISMPLENVPGKLSEVSASLEANRINILALSVVDAAGASAVRFVASDPEKAVNVLKAHGYAARMTDVLAVAFPKHPGGLNAVLKPLRDRNINVLCLYAGLGEPESAFLIVEVDKTEEAAEALKKNWIQMYDDLYFF